MHRRITSLCANIANVLCTGRGFARPALLAVLAVLLFTAGCAKYPAATAPLGGTASGNAISRTALSNVGVRYKSGGTTPSSGFDCSGLICWTYAQYGIPLPRTTSEQVKVGSAVRKNDLRPGDLVIFTTSGRRLHSGIYTGNGKFVHSPSSGKSVREESLEAEYWRTRFISGRRPRQIQ